MKPLIWKGLRLTPIAGRDSLYVGRQEARECPRTLNGTAPHTRENAAGQHYEGPQRRPARWAGGAAPLATGRADCGSRAGMLRSARTCRNDHGLAIISDRQTFAHWASGFRSPSFFV